MKRKACLRNSWCQLGAGVYYGRLEGVGVNLGRKSGLLRPSFFLNASGPSSPRPGGLLGLSPPQKNKNGGSRVGYARLVVAGQSSPGSSSLAAFQIRLGVEYIKGLFNVFGSKVHFLLYVNTLWCTRYEV